MLWKKTLKQSMIDKKNDDKKTQDLKKKWIIIILMKKRNHEKYSIQSWRCVRW